jgi:hypothetical protein
MIGIYILNRLSAHTYCTAQYNCTLVQYYEVCGATIREMSQLLNPSFNYCITLSLNPAVMLAATSLIFETGTASMSTVPTAVSASLRARAFSAALQFEYRY